MKQVKQVTALTILCEACHWRTAHQHNFQLCWYQSCCFTKL